MKKFRISFSIFLVLITTVTIFCCSKKPETRLSDKAAPRILDKVDRDSLSTDSILNLLKVGHHQFLTQDYTVRDHSLTVRKAAASGQHPMAIVLSCLDSRIPVEDVFNRGVGDLFVGRVAGNVVNKELLASMEFGVLAQGAKVIIVLGHTQCGAISAAREHFLGGENDTLNCPETDTSYADKNFNYLFAHLNPVIRAVAEQNNACKGRIADSTLLASIDSMAVWMNVQNSIKKIKDCSDTLGRLDSVENIRIVGGVFNMQTGEIDFLED